MERCERRRTVGDRRRRGTSLQRKHGLARSRFHRSAEGAYRVRVLLMVTVRVKFVAVLFDVVRRDRFDRRCLRWILYRRGEFVLVYTHVATAIASMSNVVRTGRGGR